MLTAEDLLPRCHFPDGELHCAVSGGADSTALLVLACATGQPTVAYHVDHQIRDASHVEAKLVERTAKDLGAGFVSLSVEVVDGPNLEARARAARFSVLPDGVLTGHTADDQAETMLGNLMRGAGIDGMAGIAPTNRPILELRRAETVGLCASLGIEVFEDPSNDDPRFLRNRTRHELLPLMSDLVDRDVGLMVSRQAKYFRDAGDLLDQLADAVDVTDAKALTHAHPALSARAVSRWLASELDDEMHPPGSAAIERVLAVARGEATACDVANGVSVRRSNQQLRIERRSQL